MKHRLGALLLLATTGCPTSGTVAPSDASTGDDSSLGIITEVDGMAIQPNEAGACADPAHCIFGTAQLDPEFDPSIVCPSAQCTTWQVDLFATYPSGNVQRIGTPQLVAGDGWWKFDGIGVGTDGGADGGQASGYYVEAVARFAYDAGTSTVSNVVGPIALPLPEPGVSIDLMPVQVVAYESRGAGGAAKLDWMLARVFDPTTGAPVSSGASVTVAVDGGALPLAPMVFGSETDYYAAFASPPPAQAGYLVTVQGAGYGDAGFTVPLLSDPPAFDGTVTDASVGPGGALTVSWSPEPQAGFEQVQLFAVQPDGGYAAAPAYASPLPDPPSQTSETTTPLEAGTYLVNVAFTRASCAVDGGGGCVQSAMVAATTAAVP